MVDEAGAIHPAVALLIARMNSNPEEFSDDIPWARCYQQFKNYWSAAEKNLCSAKMREIRMQVMHEALMEELLK